VPENSIDAATRDGLQRSEPDQASYIAAGVFAKELAIWILTVQRGLLKESFRDEGLAVVRGKYKV
jgi:hypothetical protein